MRTSRIDAVLKALSATLNALLLALMAFLVFVSIFKKEWAESAIAWIGTEIHSLGSWNYLLAFASSVIESFPVIGVLVPGMNVMLLVGGFFGRDHLPEMIFVAAAGAIVGNFFGYALGKRYGKSFFKNHGEIFGIGKTELKYLERQIAKNGPWFIVFGKFHNFTRAFVPFIAGSAGMAKKSFWTYNVLGSAIWAATIITLGVAFAEHYKTVIEYAGTVMLALLALFAAYVFFFKREAFLRYWEEKKAELEGAEKNKK